MHFSQQAIDLIKAYEGFSRVPYYCPGGHLTLGYGHKLLSFDQYRVIDAEEATRLLKHDLIVFSAYINQKVKVTLTQGQYDALCSLVYNWGCGSFGKSKGLIFLNQNKINLAGTEFFSREKGVVNIQGKFCLGLYKRRQAELELWNK